MKPLILNSNGQALIEAVLSLPMVILALTAILMMSYRGALYYFIDHQAHEALICLDDDSPSNCERTLKRNIKNVILFDTKVKTTLSYSSKQGRVRIETALLPSLKIEKSISFPLVKNL